MSEPEAAPQRERKREGNVGGGGSAQNAPGKGTGGRLTVAREREGEQHITAVKKQQLYKKKGFHMHS